jgi:hypothetical protein
MCRSIGPYSATGQICYGSPSQKRLPNELRVALGHFSRWGEKNNLLLYVWRMVESRVRGSEIGNRNVENISRWEIWGVQQINSDLVHIDSSMVWIILEVNSVTLHLVTDCWIECSFKSEFLLSFHQSPLIDFFCFLYTTSAQCIIVSGYQQMCRGRGGVYTSKYYIHEQW